MKPALAVSFYGPHLTGVIVYQVENGGGRLSGHWVSAAADGVVYAETLEKLRSPASPESGAYSESPPPKKPLRVARPGTDVAAR